MSVVVGCGQFYERGVINMAIFTYVRKMLQGKIRSKPVEVVREDRSRSDAMVHPCRQPAECQQLDKDIDLSHQADLEGYARGLSVSKESIERWISSGLLMPDEMKVAEKLVKIMSRN
jgi:hypothetical protein